jgi:thiol-disulfide isomerase/thioredoxin
MWFKSLLLIFSFLPFNLSATNNDLLKPGQWRGILYLNDTTELPFSFEIQQTTSGLQLTVINAVERIAAEDFRFSEDSVWWTMPVFNTKFRCKRESDTMFTGEWNNTAAGKPYVLKFRAVYGKPRIVADFRAKFASDFRGKWECTFSPESNNPTKAIGLFEMDTMGIYSGTFATEYGDYRFLEGGYIDSNEIMLSIFDGQFAMLFTVQYIGDTLQGKFWSGKYYYESWTAKRTWNFELRHPDQLAWAKDSTDVDFTFNNLYGKPVSLSDYRGKVVIVQIMGTWCPNCLDETKWMQEVYTKYQPQGLEIIGLAYERKGDTATQNAAIRRIRDRYGVTYTLLNTEKSGKDSASASLPFISGIFCFPTSIYIDKNGNVRRIHSGYNGPATGVYYQRDSEDALRFIQQLLAEKPKK